MDVVLCFLLPSDVVFFGEGERGLLRDFEPDVVFVDLFSFMVWMCWCTVDAMCSRCQSAWRALLVM